VAQRRKKADRKKTSTTRTKKDRLSTADIEHFEQMLLLKRREIISNVNEMEDETLKKSRLDASGDRKLLKEIDDALQRIEQKTYGICEGTGKPIPKARLEAQPWARYCVEYARMLEQGQVRKQEQSNSELEEYESEDEAEE